MGSRILKKARSSSIMEIIIRYKNDKISFNLYDELKVNASKLNDELKEQPSYYGFLSMLAIKLKTVRDDKLAELEKIEAELFIEFKTEIDENTNRPNSKEMANALVKVDEDYQKALKKYSKANADYAIVNSAVNSFDQRAKLIQSLAANIRREHID